MTRPSLVESGAQVIDQLFISKGSIATAGERLSSQYLAAWIIHRRLGRESVVEALSYVTPIGEKQSLIERVFGAIETDAKSVPTSRHDKLTAL